MSDEVHWLPNWKGTRLHAVVGPKPQEVVTSACGAPAYPLNDKDIKLISKGDIPRCKHCETFFPEKEKTAGFFLDAVSREKLAIEIARQLFTSGDGKRACRLVFQLESKETWGGWSEPAACQHIKRVLESFQINTGGAK